MGFGFRENSRVYENTWSYLMNPVAALRFLGLVT